MSRRKIAILTAVHFLVVCLLWTSALVVALGFGFEEQWGAVEYLVTGLVAFGIAVMALPTWVIASLGPPDWVYALLVGLQLITGYFEVKYAVKLWSCWRLREKT
ncbi:hypothetical protein ACJJH9_15730 [Microbulbifer sp. DLAB2-AF]|uniref:hypothetical protein n=1 Tax=Microbulbifer sp. DLAB2-AF TaxID=3243395 RepID=UPI004039D49A